LKGKVESGRRMRRFIVYSQSGLVDMTCTEFSLLGEESSANFQKILHSLLCEGLSSGKEK
jgi:hypothetical protein